MLLSAPGLARSWDVLAASGGSAPAHALAQRRTADGGVDPIIEADFKICLIVLDQVDVVLDVLLDRLCVAANQADLQRRRTFVVVDILVVAYGLDAAQAIVDHRSQFLAVGGSFERLFNDVVKQILTTAAAATGRTAAAATGRTAAAAERQQQAASTNETHSADQGATSGVLAELSLDAAADSASMVGNWVAKKLAATSALTRM